LLNADFGLRVRLCALCDYFALFAFRESDLTAKAAKKSRRARRKYSDAFIDPQSEIRIPQFWNPAGAGGV
jgi:hypothetical protein